MTAADVIAVLERLDAAAVPVWLDGGWGVDALVGEQTRQHADLDLALGADDLTRAEDVLQTLGFQHEPSVEPGLPARLVMRDPLSRQVDLHPLVFDENGDGWQQLSETGKAWGRYPAGHLDAVGVIAGRQVRCLTPELQLRFRLGHEWSASDEHDLRLLAERFGVSLPPTFRAGGA
jgi:lincosamide nucleotidyltransferase A/C/D/E